MNMDPPLLKSKPLKRKLSSETPKIFTQKWSNIQYNGAFQLLQGEAEYNTEYISSYQKSFDPNP